MLHASLAEYYGFESTTAVKIFMAGFAALAFLAALLLKMSLKHWIVAGMLFGTALTAPVDWYSKAFYPTWMLGVQTRRAEIHLGLGMLLSVVAIGAGRFASHRVSAQSLFMLALALFAGFMQFIHDTPGEAMQSIGFAMATIPCMVIAMPGLTRDYENCMKTLRSMMWVSVIWTVCCSIQFVINPRYLLNDGGRFWGMLANAQQAAIFVAPLAVVALWLLMNDQQRRTKSLWVALLAINLLFLMWTGSRTGAVMFVLGATLVLYTRAGKVVVLMPIALLVFIALYALAEELQIMSNVERLTSTENTRQGVWAAQIRYFLESPIIGVGWGNTGGSESSYLGGAAGYGIGYVGLILAFMAWSMWLCFRLVIGKRLLPRAQRPMVDLFIAYNASYFGGAAFEGYLLARSSTTQVMMLMFTGLGVYLREQMAEARAAGRIGIPEEDEPEADADALVDGYASDEYGFDDPAPRRRDPVAA